MIAAVLAAAVLAAPGLEFQLQLRPPDLRAPRPAAFLADDLTGGRAAGPAPHGWGPELVAGAGGALLGSGLSFALLAAAANQLDLACCASGSSRDTGSGNAGFPVLALVAAGAEVLLVPLTSSLGVKWVGGHGDGEGWRAYGYALGTHAASLLVAILIRQPALGIPVLIVGDLVLMPLAARAGWHHAPEPPPPGQAPGALSFRF